VGNATIINRILRVGRIIVSEEYVIDGAYVRNIIPNTTVAELLENIDFAYGLIDYIEDFEEIENDEISVWDKNNQEITGQSLVGTGMTLIANEQGHTLVVMGDLDGDGKVTPTDLAKMRRHLEEIDFLVDVYKKAAELTTHGQVTQADLVKVRRHLAELEFIGGEG
jgi:hypothetical protein